MHKKIQTLLHNYKFILLQQFPMLDESENSIGHIFEFKREEENMTLMYYSDTEIYLTDQEGLLTTTLQSNDLAETMASLPYALQQIIQNVECKKLEEVA